MARRSSRKSHRGRPKRRSTRGRRRRRNAEGCPPGQIRIHRKGYTTKRGTRVRPSTYCIDDPGKPGRSARGAKAGPYSRKKGYTPWIEEEGSLGKGFLTSMSFEKQKKALQRAMRREKKQHGGDYEAAYRSTLGKIMVLNRSTELRRKYGKKIDRIRDWFVKEYGAESKRWPKDRAGNPAHGDIRRLKNRLTALPRHLR